MNRCVLNVVGCIDTNAMFCDVCTQTCDVTERVVAFETVEVFASLELAKRSSTVGVCLVTHAQEQVRPIERRRRTCR